VGCAVEGMPEGDATHCVSETSSGLGSDAVATLHTNENERQQSTILQEVNPQDPESVALGSTVTAGGMDTLIIFDWDDTLLCSSSLGIVQQPQLEELAGLVQDALEQAMCLGTTMIVTNAQPTWVTESASRFIPALLPVLGRLPIISAREQQEHLHPGDYFAWKREAFRDIFKERVYGAGALNLVVLGDSPAEIQAAEYAASQGFLGSEARVKTVKFKEVPSPSDLIGQLKKVVPELDTIVAAEASFSKMLVQSTSQCDVDWSAQWEISDTMPSPELVEHLDEHLDEAFSSALETLSAESWQQRVQVTASL